jgi:hypothetical protein
VGLPAAVFHAKGLLVLAGVTRPVMSQADGRLPDRSLRGGVTAARRPAPRPRRRQARMQAVAAECGTKLMMIGLGVVEMPRELFALLDTC